MKLQNQRLMKMGKRIADWRRRKDVTLEDLANKMSISRGNLSDIENGKRDPRYSTLVAIAEGLNIKVATLLREL